MCYTMAAERKKAIHPCARPCVKNGNEEVFDYLSKVFDRQNMYFCRPGDNCMFVCPKDNLSFEVTEPLEFSIDCGGKIKGLIPIGTWRIAKHITRPDCHFLFLEKIENGQVTNHLSCQAGWKDGLMIDWRGIRPVKKS